MTRTSHLDILSAIWILASNDENSLITFGGLRHRLGLESGFDVKSLIKLHGELFRPQASQNSLDSWKAQMLAGQRLPAWIKAIKDPNERTQTINQLSVDDIFRSQFRAKNGTPPSEISIINWGLEHIDRIRKLTSEEKQDKYRTLTSFWIPILTTLILAYPPNFRTYFSVL